MIYDFLESKGVDIVPYQKALRKLLISYAKDEHQELLGEVIVLRSRVRRHRAVINGMKTNQPFNK